MSVDVSKAVCQQLMESSTATLTSVLRLHGLKNTFMHGAAPLGPGMKIAGPAFTLRYIPAREDLDEIRQTDEGLVAKSGCIGVGKGEPNSVQHRIEGEDGEGKHRWCDVEMG